MAWCRKNAGKMAKHGSIKGRIIGVATLKNQYDIYPVGSPLIEILTHPDPLKTTQTGFEYFFKSNEARDGYVYSIEVVELCEPETDMRRYPHACPFCKKPAYIGAINMLDCSAKCR